MRRRDAFPIAPGMSTVQTDGLCELPPPGWAIVREKELADDRASDRYLNQTCVVTASTGNLSFFFPFNVDSENRVHVFFAANFVAGNAGNDLACHAARHAGDLAGWILVGVTGLPENGTSVTAQQIRDQLESHGYSRRIDRLRLSAHSRGGMALANSLSSGAFVAQSATGDLIPTSVVERVVSFDSAIHFASVQSSGIDTGNLYGYNATAPWDIPSDKTVHLNVSPLAQGMAAITYVRLINDTRSCRPDIKIPDDISALADKLPLANLGDLSSRNLRAFCDTNARAISDIVGIEFRDVKAGGRPCDLNRFVDANNLARLGIPMIPIVCHHHLFVSEVMHEVTDDAPPLPQ